MSRNDRITRITRLLNKSFYNMAFDDKKKVLSMVISEEECDEILIKFLARQYNVDYDLEKSKIDTTEEKRGQVYLKSIHKNDDELEDIESPEPTPTPIKLNPNRIKTLPVKSPQPIPTPVRVPSPTPTPIKTKGRTKTPQPTPTPTLTPAKGRPVLVKEQPTPQPTHIPILA